MSLRTCLLVLAACGSRTARPDDARPPAPIVADARGPSTAEPWSEAWLADEAVRFIDDDGARRASLEASLVNHANVYSAQRLGSYGLVVRGWDALPIWNPRSRPIDGSRAAALEAGAAPALPDATAPLWDRARPTTQAGWVALGRRVFFEYPLRSEIFMEYGLTKRALVDQVGVERPADGSLPGLVEFADVDGRHRVGITCAVCHTSVDGGALVVGAARRKFDYGRLRLAYYEGTGSPLDENQARRMASWGPGRADVTEDDDEDPVAIPDLWGLRHETYLTQAGTIRHVGPAALAIRQETQLLHANHQRIRPPRELAWALAMFLYALEPPPAKPARDAEVAARGEALFATHCDGCHRNGALGGDAIAADLVGTDRSLAFGTARGTGRYRVAPLVRVARAAPYLHHGMVASLDELLSPTRAEPGHTFGTKLPAPDRAALVAYLETL